MDDGMGWDLGGKGLVHPTLLLLFDQYPYLGSEGGLCLQEKSFKNQDLDSSSRLRDR